MFIMWSSLDEGAGPISWPKHISGLDFAQPHLRCASGEILFILCIGVGVGADGLHGGYIAVDIFCVLCL